MEELLKKVDIIFEKCDDYSPLHEKYGQRHQVCNL